MNTSAIYQSSDLTKLYGTRTVLSIAQLEIERGQVFCVVGPSGAGKSTLLRLLNFLESPTSGTLCFDGIRLNGNVALDVRRRVTTVFQKPILLHGTVEQNVAYGLRVRGIKHSASRTAQALEQVGLADLARASARTLSGGETQRVALARAIVIEPEVLLLDEPTANLDPYNISLIEKIVSDLNRERGTTIVMVTHNVFQAKRLAQRAMLLLGGRSIEVAEAQRFFTTPSDPRTAAFVRGEMIY
jgi:tungstate transport system ATP-binding protein